MTIDATSDSFVLEGRVVTMGPIGIIDDGAIFIESGTIVHVGEAGERPAPEGFSRAERVKTGGTIYPGMIELHNHLSYNAIPLWLIPKRYAHNGSWRGKPEATRSVGKPAQVLANTDGMVEAIVRFAECRCLLGGVTTSQGITLKPAGQIVNYYDGLVRNVERPDHEQLPKADAKIGDPPKDPNDYLEDLENTNCLLQHLCEGFGETPHKRFLRLKFADGTWAINDKLCGIHSTALTPEDFGVLGGNGGSMVWSPLSNYLLYGQTADIVAAKDAKVPIALGSDWAPSGSKNLLGELKVAKLISDELGGAFTDEELVKMVTITPAEICKWDGLLGSINNGKLADLVVVHGHNIDPFTQLVKARATSLTLVVIDGIPRVGQNRLMKRFGPATEQIVVGSSERTLNLRPRPGDDLLDGINLQEAKDRLSDGLARLPELAEKLDRAIADGFDPNRGSAGEWFDQNIEPKVRIVLDFEEDDALLDPSLALGAGDLADWVEPMAFEDLTVADDRRFLRKIVRQKNLPDFLINGLPLSFGERISIPDRASLIEEGEGPGIGPTQSIELHDFHVAENQLSADARKRIVDQAITLLNDYYVHLPMKRTMHGIDPIQRLWVIRHEIDQARAEEQPSDLEFHIEVSAVFDSLRDLHTVYRLPRPYRGKVAWLPFLIEECWRGDQKVFLVSKIVGNPGPESFQVGVEVLYWNGTPIARHISRLTRQMPAGNHAARRARAMNSLTLRSFTRGQVPNEEWVTLQYRTTGNGNGEIHQFTQPWLVSDPEPGTRALSPQNLKYEASAIGLDDHTDDLQQAKAALYAPTQSMVERDTARGAIPYMAVPRGTVPTRLPTIFCARHITRNRVPYGYLRVYSFNVDSADEFVDEFERLLLSLPKKGLIIDVRGNGGGLIHAAERSLELLSPVPISPEPAQFINTPSTLRLCNKHKRSEVVNGLELWPWLSSMEHAVGSGATHSQGFPVTESKYCNSRGQQYQGPVVLIVDALCYSATDMFIAGFLDHNIGTVIGLHNNTGAGGANVWSHRLLKRLTGGRLSHLEHLPQGADIRVAIRRTLRVGARAGEIVEDFGVAPDSIHRMTPKDLLENNRNLIDEAVEVLGKQTPYRLSITEDGPHLRVATKNIDHIGITADGRAMRSRDIRKNQTTIRLAELPKRSPEKMTRLEIVGFREDVPRVRRRFTIGSDGSEGGQP